MNLYQYSPNSPIDSGKTRSAVRSNGRVDSAAFYWACDEQQKKESKLILHKNVKNITITISKHI